MTLRRYASRKTPEHDVVGQAGWMYTDLMLALMVVFLATISFVPNFSIGTNDNQDLNQSDYSYSSVYGEGLNIIYERFDADQVEADISRFKKTQGLPAEAVIVFAQYVGGYLSNTESPSKAISRALDFSKRLDKAKPVLLENAATTLSSSNVLKQNQVIVRFTFATPSRLGKK